MRQPLKYLRTNWVNALILFVLLTFGGISLLIVIMQSATQAQFGVLLLHLFTFAILFAFSQRLTNWRWLLLIFGLQTALIINGFQQLDNFNLLFLPLAIQMVRRLGVRFGLGLTVCLAAVNFYLQGASGTFSTQDIQDGLLNGVLILFMTGFVAALTAMDAERTKNQQLLTDLQAANLQLRTYAQQVKELAVAEERNRLSRDLHDTLGHRLTVSVVQLEGAAKLTSTDPTRAAGIIHTVREQLQEGLSEVRRTVAMLRSPSSHDLSLPAALRQLAADFEQATHTTVHLQLPDLVPPLPTGHRLALYRAAQEALTNVERHAQATAVWLTLTVDHTHIQLILRDNGMGIPKDAATYGFGLRGMTERLTQLGGTLAITTEDGTRLTIILPLHTESAHA